MKSNSTIVHVMSNVVKLYYVNSSWDRRRNRQPGQDGPVRLATAQPRSPLGLFE